MARLVVPMALIASLCGCAAPAIPACAPGFGTSVAVFTLFLGKAIPGREDLTDREWQAFLASTVTANLPDGYTVFDANGGWMDPVRHKTIREGTKVLLVALPEGPQSLAAINRIRTAYQTRFRQQLVGMTVEHACGTF
ncbi:MAG: DUF3574 domain-containing protein [Rhodopila sp.]|jgi:hypothetical protein